MYIGKRHQPPPPETWDTTVTDHTVGGNDEIAVQQDKQSILIK